MMGISREITDSKRTEDALRKCEERCQLLSTSINDAILIHEIHADGGPEAIVEVNDITCERLEYAREELLRMSAREIVAPEALAALPEAMQRLRAEGHVVYESMHLSRNGRKIPVEISNRLFELDGTPMVFATVRDIAERKKAELALRQEAIRRRILFDEASEGIVILDRDAKVVEANRSFLNMLGYSWEEIAQLHLWDWDVLFPTKELTRMPWSGSRRKSGTVETRHRRKDGLVYDVEITFTLATFSAEMQVYCVCRNITERKQTEERIQNLARIPDEDPNPVMRVALDGSLLYRNLSSRLLLPTWAGVRGGRIPSACMPALLQAWTSGEKREIEVREGKNTFALTIAPISSGGYINLYGRDVTEEKSLSGKFMQAQKMEAIGRLAGGIAHDFNNLLTVIIGYCGLAQEELPEGGAVKVQVGEIARAAKQAATLTAQLLAFSRKQVLVPRVINPNELVRVLEKILTRVVGEDIELATSLPREAGNLRADPGQIEQAIMNLVVNARDAMPHGGKLTIETSNQTLDDAYVREHPGVKPGEYVRIAVSDTGIGMDREVVSHVFEPFFTTKEQGKGTGLGLSTVYGIVKQSEGNIICSSEPNKGTTFMMYFPRTAEASEVPAAPIVGISTFHGSETILLVEDDKAVRAFARTVLKGNGYAVIEAAGGEEALAEMASRTHEVALLVTDVVMPRMSGKELAKELVHDFPDLKVLFISGYTGRAIENNEILDSCADFMQKPFSSQELLAKIREILDSRT